MNRFGLHRIAKHDDTLECRQFRFEGRDTREVETPLAGLNIVETQTQGFDVSGGSIDRKLRQIAWPFHTLRTTVVPSYSTQVLEPVSGCWRRFK